MNLSTDVNATWQGHLRQNGVPAPKERGNLRVKPPNQNMQLQTAAESSVNTTGFPRLLESHGIFSLDFPGPGKSWKMS